MTKDLKITNYRHITLTKELRNKYARLQKKGVMLHGSINKISNGWSREQADALVQAIQREIDIDPFSGVDGIVSSDGLSRMLWKHIPRGKFDRGRKGNLSSFRKGEVPIAVASSVLRIDLGLQNNEYNRKGLAEAGQVYPEISELNKHLRLGSGGLCFCTILAKVTRKNWERIPNGKSQYAGPAEVELYVVPSAMLDILFGERDNQGGRSLENLPQSWMDARDREIQEAVRRSSPSPEKVSKRRREAPKVLPGDAALKEAYGSMKNDQLRKMCKDNKLDAKGNKLDLLKRLSGAGLL